MDDLLAQASRGCLRTCAKNLERAGVWTRGRSACAALQQGWEETLYAPTADGTQVLNTVTETIMVPDFTLPANYMQQGRVLKYTLFFDTRRSSRRRARSR
jgi:hypothetical protein